jgi:protein-tyrosine phosphatase
MIDLHCHILPGIDDGATDVSVSLAMARLAVDQGVEIQACTPHILPGLYANTGPQIRADVERLQARLDEEGVPLRLVVGADAHMTPDMAAKLRSGEIPSLADTRYVLVEPPHHVAPPNFEGFFFDLLIAGYAPILTHPERLTWIESHYAKIPRLVAAGVWMQVTAGSLTGSFGRRPLYWAERMLNEGLVHLLATDAHSASRRRPNLAEGRDAAAHWVGAEEADRMVIDRPYAVLSDIPPSQVPAPLSGNRPSARRRPGVSERRSNGGMDVAMRVSGGASETSRETSRRAARRPGLVDRLRSVFY